MKKKSSINIADTSEMMRLDEAARGLSQVVQGKTVDAREKLAELIKRQLGTKANSVAFCKHGVVLIKK
jgi:hypothetical protein